MTRLLSGLLSLAVVVSTANAADKKFTLTLDAGKYDRVNTPIGTPIALPKALAENPLIQVKIGEDQLRGQFVRASNGFPALAKAGKDEVSGWLCFVLPRLEAGKSATAEVTVAQDMRSRTPAMFRWQDHPGEYSELALGNRPVLRYSKRPLDDSTTEKREETFKVFHHVYDPTGKEILTKGPGGQFTHHRGLFYGFMKTTYGKNVTVDTWHCKEDTHLAHDRTLLEEGGEVLGRHAVNVLWKGKGKETFAEEERELVTWNVPGGILIDFVSVLRPTEGTVKLDGDPQHAGFHFRASNEVASANKGKTYFLRPDGKGEEGKERNWPQAREHVNLPWNAMSFVVGGKRYTAVYLDRPDNPKEARFSERTYGRFGSYFVAEATKEKPLRVHYRVWLQEGELKSDAIERLSRDFVHPISVK